MSSNLDVLWVEGSLLTAHHLQAMTRRQETLLDARLRALPSSAWGVVNLDVDEAALESGTIVVREVGAILRDGSCIAQTSPLSRALDRVLTPSTRVYLALPALGRGSEVDPGAGIPARYDVVPTPMPDRHGDGGTRTLQLGRLAPILQLEGESAEGFERIEIMQLERVSGSAWRMSARFAPRVLRANTAPALQTVMDDVLGAMQARRRRVLTELGGGTVDDLARANPVGFWLIHTLNGAIARVRHIIGISHASPDEWFGALAHTAGELCTFHDGADPSRVPALRSEDLFGSFSKMAGRISELLEVRPPARFTEIPLVREGAVWSGPLPPLGGMRNAVVLLLLYMQDDRPVTSSLLEAIKVGAPGRVAYYAEAGLPGVTLRLLDGTPSDAPRRKGARYVSVRTRSPRWRECEEDGQVALHVPRTVGLARVEALVVHGGSA